MMPAEGRGRRRAGGSNSQTKAHLQRLGVADGGVWLTTVELLGGEGDDGAAVQDARSLAGGCGLDAALLCIFLQQLCQPQQVTVTEQRVGVQPPATARERQLRAQPADAAPPSPGSSRGTALQSEGSLGWFALHWIISQGKI